MATNDPRSNPLTLNSSKKGGLAATASNLMSATSGYATVPPNSITLLMNPTGGYPPAASPSATATISHPSSHHSAAAVAQMHQQHQQQQQHSQIGSGCQRPYCTYIHNTNVHSDRGAPLCAQYTTNATCEDANCTGAHNINPYAPATAPECHDFRNMIRRQNMIPVHSTSAAPAAVAAAAGGYYNYYPYMVNESIYNAAFVPPGMTSGCRRPNCTYIHNVNPKAPRDAASCSDFRLGNCVRTRCCFTHNVNPNAVKGSPQCADFGKDYNRRLGLVDSAQSGRNPIKICADFAKSRCERDICAYVHNVNVNCGTHATPQSQICADFAHRGCKRENCTYLHNVNPRAGPSPPVAQVPESISDILPQMSSSTATGTATGSPRMAATNQFRSSLSPATSSSSSKSHDSSQVYGEGDERNEATHPSTPAGGGGHYNQAAHLPKRRRIEDITD